MSVKPSLSDWAIIRVTLPGNSERPRYHFTGISHGHPCLPDCVQIVTTEIQEIGKDGKYARTRSRAYSLGRMLLKEEFTPELSAEVADILRYEIRQTYAIAWIPIDIEWISIEDWRATAEEENAKVPTSSVDQFESKENAAASPSEEEVEAILAAARERGEARRENMIDEAGGLLSTAEAADISGLSPRELGKRMNKSLLAVPQERGVGWPRFQFESQAMMAAIGRVMKRLDIQGPWMQLNFFLMRLDELGGVRPIDAIKAGNIRAAEIAASHFGTHGGS